MESIARLPTAIIEWMRAGYPEGIPPTDYIHPLAVLPRRLNTNDVTLVAHKLMRRGDFDHIDIGVAITQPPTSRRLQKTSNGYGNGWQLKCRRRTTHPTVKTSGSPRCDYPRAGS